MLPFQARLKIKEITKRLKKIKGKRMEDFDFDALLDDIETTEDNAAT